MNRRIKGEDEIWEFHQWIKKFKEIIKLLEILHLLRFPAMSLNFPTEFLLSKFGTFNKIPLCGCGLGDETRVFFSFISSEEKEFIQELSMKDDEVQYIIKWFNDLPDLTELEVKKLIIEEEKENIRHSGFENWISNSNFHDDRIDENMVQLLKNWAQENNLLSLESILDNLKKNNQDIESSE